MLLIRICIPFVFILTITSTNLLDLCKESNTEATNDLLFKPAMDCISVITNKYMPCGTLITSISTISYMDTLTKLLSDRICYNFIIRSFLTEEWIIWPDMYIISINNFSQIYSSFKNLSRDIAWNPKAQFVILIYDLKQPERDDVLKILLSLNIFNLFLITKWEKDELQVNTYKPFDNNRCGRSFDKVINTSNCGDTDFIRMNYTYLEKQFRNCTMDIAGVEDVPHFIYPTNKEYSFLQKNVDGLEQYMLSNIAKQENLTLQYTLAPPGAYRGVVLTNWTVTGVLGYLHNKTADIAVGGYMLLRNRLKLFDCIWGYNHATFFVFTPAVDEINWNKVYQEFSVSTWILIALSYCFVTVISIFIGKYLVRLIYRKYFPLKLWGYFFGNTNSKLIRIKKLRIIMIVWIWFTFFIINFYNTAFYSLLTAKSKEKMSYLNKSLDSLPFKPCISDNTRIFFQYKFNVNLTSASNDKCKYTDAALDTVANSDEYFALEKKHAYNIREFKYIDDKGNRKIEGFRYTEYIMFAIYTRRGFPFQEKIRRYAFYHIESGLLKHHASRIYHRYTIHNKQFSREFTAFSLTDFRIHFGVLFVGYAISIICFIIEINR